ncbi:MAG TPA: hypothetical protein VHW60_00205 [Caulobacteraceae bacterium]|nr:hypothetical protein [Caulobacteraceae bacterium]
MRPAAILAGALMALAGSGAEAGVVNPGDTVAGHPGETYLDLAKQLVPGLATNDHVQRRLDVAVSAVVTHSGDDDCGPVHMPKPQTRTFRASWNAAQRRYEDDGSAFERLAVFTDTIMK